MGSSFQLVRKPVQRSGSARAQASSPDPLRARIPQRLRIRPGRPVGLATGGKEVVAKLPTGLDNRAIGPDDQVYVSNMTDNDIRLVNPANGSSRILVQAL